MPIKLTNKKLDELKAYPVSYRLQNLRWISGYSQVEFAKLVKCTQATVSMWERGQCIPSGKMIMRIIELYGLPDNYFIDIDVEKVKLQTKRKKIQKTDEHSR